MGASFLSHFSKPRNAYATANDIAGQRRPDNNAVSTLARGCVYVCKMINKVNAIDASCVDRFLMCIYIYLLYVVGIYVSMYGGWGCVWGYGFFGCGVALVR